VNLVWNDALCKHCMCRDCTCCLQCALKPYKADVILVTVFVVNVTNTNVIVINILIIKIKPVDYDFCGHSLHNEKLNPFPSTFTVLTPTSGTGQTVQLVHKLAENM